MKVKVQGYKLNNYNATYQKANFFFEEQNVGDGLRNIKVIDLESGQEFWLTVPFKVETPSRKAKRNKLGTNNISRNY